MSLLAHLNLNYLRIFLVVYRSKSMTQAAKELHMTQSGVSQQIKALEDSLRLTLFDRVNRRIIPTREAEILFRECSRHLENLETALREITSQDSEITGRIKIGVSLEADDMSLASLLAQFSENFPQISLDLRSAMSKDLYQNLVNGQLDCAFVLDRPDERLFESQSLATQSYRLYVSSAVAAKLEGSPDCTGTLLRRQFLGLPGDDRLLQQLLTANQLTREDRGLDPLENLTVTSLHTLARLTAAGLGYSILPASLDLVGHYQLVAPLADVHLERQVWFCYLAKRSFSIAAEQLIKACISIDATKN